MPFENQIEMAWAAALILVLLVLVINIIMDGAMIIISIKAATGGGS